MVYNTLKPAANDNLNVSQGDIQGNFLTANTVMNVDHVPFNDLTAQQGYHKDIHSVKRVGNMAAVAGVYGLFNKDVTPDTTGGTADNQLFGITAGGQVTQFTGYNTSNSTDGWCWLGGILIQWGKVSSTSNGAVTFKDRFVGAIPFPNNCFNVSTTEFYNGTAPNGSASVGVKNISKTAFTWVFNSNSGSYNGFYWVALGN